MTYSKQLYHYGVAGQRWGQRKYQNYDGTYTDAGKLRYFGQTSGRPMSGRPTSTNAVLTGKITGSNAQRMMGNGAPSYVNAKPKYYRTVNGTGNITRPATSQPITNFRVIDRTHGQRMMGNGAPSYVKQPTVGYNPAGGYQMSAKQKARMDAAAKKYAATQAAIAAEAERKRKAAEAAAASKSKGKKGSGSKSKKSEEEKAAEKAAKEAEREKKKAEREAEKAAKKKASESSKRKKEQEKAAKEKAKEESAKANEQEAKEKEEASKKHDPIDDDETLSEREKKMYKGISNILEKTGQSMSTYYKNEGFDAIFARYFPGDIDPDEKKVIKKKFMNYYKLEHGEAAVGEYYAVTYSSSLSHHGILGMKWGIRRYQNEDGTLTEAGKKRYGSIDRFNKEMHNREVRKKNFKKAGRMLSKNIKSGNTYRYILAENYKTNYGMDSKSAKAAAKRRADFTKKVAIGAGVAIGVGAAVAGGIYLKRRHDTLTREVLDSVLKSGTKIQTLSLFPDRLTSGKAFYESHRKEDMARYIRDFGKGSRNLFEAPEYKYKLNATVDKDIKVAGIKTGAETFKSLMNNNSEFKDLFETSVAPGHVRHVGAAASDYNKFNTLALLMPGEKYERMRTIFFDELKSKGYGAVADINDRKNNSFKTHANIVFDHDSFVKNNQGIMNVEIRKLNSLDRLQAEKILNKKVQRETWEEILSTPTTSASFATTAACVALGTFDAKEGINYHLEKSKRSKEKK